MAVIKISDNATNGDAIKALFPKTIFIQEKVQNKLKALMISDEWWNAPYIKEQNNAPTIDAQPVIHGEWLGTEYDGYSDGFPVYTTWKCSNCGAEFEREDMDFYYCPNCGAKMIEPQESEDKE